MPPLVSSENILVVSPAEHGMKLIRFLQRRLSEPFSEAALHKWIRTGQVRINRSRPKPFSLLRTGDQVRVPPFATPEPRDFPLSDENGPMETRRQSPLAFLEASGLGLVADLPGLLLLDKPAGLAVQPGSGQSRSVSGLLRQAWEGSPWYPAPAHRLDRETSGLLAVGTSHRSQSVLHQAFGGTGQLRKDYLAWVSGRALGRPGSGPYLLLDRLIPREQARPDLIPEGWPQAKMLALPEAKTVDLSRPIRDGESGPPALPGLADSGLGQEARSLAVPLLHLPAGSIRGYPGQATLCLIRLLTGRTHQIRVQFASRGWPVLGDRRYAGPAFRPMLLHSWRLALSPELAGSLAWVRPPAGEAGEWTAFSRLPGWPEVFMPRPLDLETGLDLLDTAEAELQDR